MEIGQQISPKVHFFSLDFGLKISNILLDLIYPKTKSCKKKQTKHYT